MSRQKSIGIILATLACMGGFGGVFMVIDYYKHPALKGSVTLLSLKPTTRFSFQATLLLKQSGHSKVEFTTGEHEIFNPKAWESSQEIQEDWELWPEAYSSTAAPDPNIIRKRVKLELGKEYPVQAGERLILYDYTPAGDRPRLRFLTISRH